VFFHFFSYSFSQFALLLLLLLLAVFFYSYKACAGFNCCFVRINPVISCSPTLSYRAGSTTYIFFFQFCMYDIFFYFIYGTQRILILRIRIYRYDILSYEVEATRVYI
ncbi:Uncharacterized protein FWK35_00026753, partial [Aphis craccivora]